MTFQQDSALSHKAIIVAIHFNETCLERWNSNCTKGHNNTHNNLTKNLLSIYDKTNITTNINYQSHT